MPSATKENKVTSVPMFFFNILLILIIIKCLFYKMLRNIEFPGPVVVLFHSYIAILTTAFQGTSINYLKDGFDPSSN